MEENRNDTNMKNTNNKNRHFKPVLRIVILAAAVAFIVTGVLTHGFADVRSKAVMICLECIGIG